MEWYELKGHPMDAALPPLQAASEEAALGTFARELNLKLDFAEEGETGEYVLTNTSTWKEWWGHLRLSGSLRHYFQTSTHLHLRSA
jgi:hypothetical protein